MTALIIGFILLGYLFLKISDASASKILPISTSTPPITEDPVEKQYQVEIDQYRQDLNNPNLSTESREIVEANLKFAEQKATERAIALAQPNESKLDSKLTAIAQETKNPSAIENITANPLPSRGIHYDPSFIYINDAEFYSAWVEPSEKDTLWFLGGVLKADKKQGVVYVFHASNRQVEKYYTPTKSGILKTYGFESNRIIFNSEKGTVFKF